MVYLINGEKSLIDKEVNDLIKKYNTTSIIKYDLVFNKISDVINDINTVNLFSDKKVVICSSINNIDNIDILVKYLDNQNDNILILTNEDKIDLKILNKIKNKNIEKIDLSNIDLTSFIKEEFKDYKISFKEINMLKDYTSNDYNRIKEEIIKLKMYKLDTKEINEDDIKKLVTKNLDKNILYVAHGDDNKYLISDSCIVEMVNWNADRNITECSAKFRYRQKDNDVKVKFLDDGNMLVSYEQGVKSVTPGQACVFYLGEECLGGGIIKEVRKNGEKLWYL